MAYKEHHIPPSPIIDMKNSKENLLYLNIKLKALSIASQSKSKEMQDEAIHSILEDLIEGAYQDRIFAYSRKLLKNYGGSSKAFYDLQKI